MSSRFARPQGEDEQRTTSLELFYDLVFVFAITQISHHLLEHLTWEGAGQSTLLLLVVWWSWNYTAWVTNELDPESPVVRLLMIALMLASLMMAVAIPHAFGERRAAVRLLLPGDPGRPPRVPGLRGAGRGGPVERERAGADPARGSSPPACSGWRARWPTAARADDPVADRVGGGLRRAAGACTGCPGRRRLPGSTWMVETAHFSERFGLFIIIALGESIVVTGATTSELGLTTRPPPPSPPRS